MPQSWDMGQILSLPRPEEGTLRIFTSVKIQRLRPGLKPQTSRGVYVNCSVVRLLRRIVVMSLTTIIWAIASLAECRQPFRMTYIGWDSEDEVQRGHNHFWESNSLPWYHRRAIIVG